MKKIFSVDRFEGDIAVCISDDGEKLHVRKSALGDMTVRDIFEAEVVNGELLGVVPMPEERDRRIEQNRKRLHDLARRNKK